MVHPFNRNKNWTQQQKEKLLIWSTTWKDRKCIISSKRRWKYNANSIYVIVLKDKTIVIENRFCVEEVNYKVIWRNYFGWCSDSIFIVISNFMCKKQNCIHFSCFVIFFQAWGLNLGITELYFLHFLYFIWRQSLVKFPRLGSNLWSLASGFWGAEITGVYHHS